MVMYIQPEFCKYTGRVIYKLIFPDRKVYIGLASIFHKRIDGHKKEAYAKTDGDWVCNSICKQAIREFGWDNVKVEIMEFVPKWTSLRDRERYWIAQYQSWKEEYGYNSNKGGGGVIQHTEETKAKISAAQMGHTHTEEAKAKISAAQMGHTNTPTKPVTSREIKEEYADGTQLVEFVSYASAAEAERQTGVHATAITACCLEKHNSAGRRLWHFTKERDLVGEHRVNHIGDMPKTCPRRAVISTSPAPERKKQRHEGSCAAKRTLSKATGKKFNDSAISKCCRGKRKSHHGYTFCFE